MPESNQLVSFLIFTDKLLNKGNLSFFSDYDVYTCSLNEFSKMGREYVRYEKQMHVWRETTCHDITTPWVVLLEEDEFLTPKELKKLLNHCNSTEENYAYVNVERHLSYDTMNRFAWVKTRRIFVNPPVDTSKFYTSELRLIQTKQLCNKNFVIEVDKGIARGFSLFVDSEHHENSKISVSRITNTKSEKKLQVPDDRDIFKHGHQKYYDDRIYCPGFQWPRTIYSNIRFDYIPSILRALKEGLSSPEIVTFALIYLIRFRDFDTASEIIKFVPEDWFCENHFLINALGTIEFANGMHDKAIRTFSRAVALFPDNDIIVKNTIKMYIMMQQFDKIDAIEAQYLKATGHALDDVFIRQFKEVYKEGIKKPASTSLCMIIKNEAKYLERALKSAKDMVDEIIIVDAGSTDDSLLIAEKYGARFFHLPWQDNFSLARNYAVDKATGDYIFMLDADEYVSPFFFMESQILIKHLPTDSPCAFRLPVGHYYSVSDWLFMIQSEGNFILENTPVRIFPNIPGIKYKGLIDESVEEALSERGIPIHFIPEDSFHILHESQDRQQRIIRKCHIYSREPNPTASQILSAVMDYSIVGDKAETLNWLKRYSSLCEIADPKYLRILLNLAKLLESVDTNQAETLYNNILNNFPQENKVLMDYGSFLLKNNKFNDIQFLPFKLPDECTELQGKERLNYLCFTSLKYFESGDFEKAFAVLDAIFTETIYYPFAQSLKFYYLVCQNQIEPAINTLDDLLHIFSVSRNYKLDELEDLIKIIEDLSEVLHEKGYINERLIIIRGTILLEELWRII